MVTTIKCGAGVNEGNKICLWIQAKFSEFSNFFYGNSLPVLTWNQRLLLLKFWKIISFSIHFKHKYCNDSIYYPILWISLQSMLHYSNFANINAMHFIFCWNDWMCIFEIFKKFKNSYNFCNLPAFCVWIPIYEAYFHTTVRATDFGSEARWLTISEFGPLFRLKINLRMHDIVVMASKSHFWNFYPSLS